MALMRLQYDAYNRQFKILDRELAPTLKDGEIYTFVSDISVNDDLDVKQSADVPVELIPVTA